MSKTSILKAALRRFTAITLLGWALCPAASAQPAGYFSFFDDGGEHTPEACEATARLPGGLRNRLKGTLEYLGSKQVEFAARNEAGIDAFQHYFRSRKSCETALKQVAAQAEQ